MTTVPLLTKSEIQEFCGTAYYTRGKKYFEEGRIKSLVETANGQVDGYYEWYAEVRGTRTYSVTIEITEMNIDGFCNCPAYDEYNGICKHVAAVLLCVEAQGLPAVYGPVTDFLSSFPFEDADGTVSNTGHSIPVSKSFSGEQRSEATTNTSHLAEMSNRLLSIFRSTLPTSSQNELSSPRQSDNLQPLRVEFICKPYGRTYSMPDHIRLEMKVGPKKTYIVKKIREFLQIIEARESHTFTSKFTYDASLQQFDPDDLAVITELQRIHKQEVMFKEFAGYSSYYRFQSPMHDERTLLIPPSAWTSIYPKLVQSNAVLHAMGPDVPLQVVDNGLPIMASVSGNEQGEMFSLELAGLEDLLLLPSYNAVVSSTGVHQIDEAIVQQLEGLQSIMNAEQVNEISFSSDALGPIMNEVLPQLKRIADVQVDKKISNRVVEAPLDAKLFLDKEVVIAGREELDRLDAQLQFVYGDTIISPYGGNQSSDVHALENGPDAILIRDWVKEQRILHMLEECRLHRDPDTGSFYVIGEEEIYQFLFEQVPTLREVVQVYATSAVDSWMQPSSFTPRTRVELDEKTNWLDVSFDMGDLDEQEIIRVLKSMVERKKYHRLSNGAFLSLQEDSFREISQLVENLGIRSAELKRTKLQLPALRALSLMETEQTNVPTGLHVKLGKSLRRWLDNLRNPDNLEAALPEGINATLREYQVFGYQWMKTIAKYGFGGILADDMGLGKTLQGIAYLLSEKECGEIPAANVIQDGGRIEAVRAGSAEVAAGIASSSVLTPVDMLSDKNATQQRAKEPSLIVCPASLTFNWLNEIQKFTPQLKAAVAAGTKAERQNILDSYSQYDVIITSYPLLWRDIESYRAVLFGTLILDEAQAIKNPQTQTAQAVFQIHSKHRFALTGTPVENTLDDLWSIFRAVFPELLGRSSDFSKLSADAVSKRVRPFILRRTKRDVLKELPEKIETLHTAELTTDQKKHYLAYLTRLQQDAMNELEQEGFQKGRFRILSGLTRLRQICCHPSLCIENYRGKSGKMEQLLELVSEYISSKQRMLIFSQFTSMLEIIGRELTKQGIPYLYLDGQTPSKKRIELCQDFNEGDVPVFLISLKAGGTGLNLTGADTVILYDLWWNPAVEQQAADRAHRIGQKRTVQVVRMVTKGTIEEKIYKLQERKRDFIDAVVQANNEGLGALTEEDVRELLMI